MKKCKRCQEHLYGHQEISRHHCRPFTVQLENDGDYYEIYGVSENDVAERFAEIYNESGRLIDHEVLIYINDKEFLVGAEQEITFTVEEI